MTDARLLAPENTKLVLKATGGGAYLFHDKLEERLPGVIVQKEDEMDCLITGNIFFLLHLIVVKDINYVYRLKLFYH